MKTFREFQETRQPVDDLSEFTQDDDLAGKPGFIYDAGCYIQESSGMFHLVIGNLCWVSSSIEEVELKLYAYWYVEEAQ